MKYSDEVLYEALKAKDPRFDGRFFVGISSTGIYCRPVCRAKQPKLENCTFFKTAAEAERAGYRPCLLCRPELAPGTSLTDATANLVHRATRLLEESCGNRQSIEEIADKLGYSARHLRRAFMEEYNVSPMQYLQTCRLLLAKNLLTETNLSVLDVAMAAGFGSLRRFNSLFKKHYNLSPSSLRKRLSGEKKNSGNITLALGYRPPYDWNEMLRFLADRAIRGVELVTDGKYIRTVDLTDTDKKHVYGWVQVSHKPKKSALSLTVSETLLPLLPQVLARIRNLFDLYCDPSTIYETLQVMNQIKPGLSTPGTRVPGCLNSFEMAVRAVLGQQITMKAANTLAGRIVETYGTAVQTDIPGLTHSFPSPEDILALNKDITESFGVLGVTSRRSNTIYALAQAISQGSINLDLCADPEEEMKKLKQIPGIGNWTAQYIAMRAMEWTDSFLETDVGIKKALPNYTPNELLKLSEAWRPWRSYATVNLWNAEKGDR